MKRFQARGRSARFVRNTPENSLGMHIGVCPKCHRLNSRPVGDPPPTECHACGHPFPVHVVDADGACLSCGQSSKIPAFIDPVKLKRGLLCRTCGRETP